MDDQPTVPASSQVSVTRHAIVPAIIEHAGPDAKRRFVEFFTANIHNENTRQAYYRAIRRFCQWCSRHRIGLHAVEPALLARYVSELGAVYSPASVKQHLAAIRMLFDYLVTGQVVPVNPASPVRGPKLVVTKGKSPVLTASDARQLIDSIDVETLIGLRDRALIGVLVYSFARISAALSMNVEDVYRKGHRMWIRLHEKGGRYHEMPLHHNAEKYLIDYLQSACASRGEPVFRSFDRNRNLTHNRLTRSKALSMVKRRATVANVNPDICCHTFRATGITEYMRNGGTLEKAQQMAAHSSSRTTNMYNRVADDVSLDEVERIVI